ncbi:hypothetical protein NDU88_002476 [Pleurodeles waltl]|uniref:Uncharacterized protein n=1 Tax=Pleurodeles waltl TaxID=8319 RepID=A0AAV7WLJ9_PLEWA|nr:hypothetical protein NDU88_002476 [Pleurodeles waltl]
MASALLSAPIHPFDFSARESNAASEPRPRYCDTVRRRLEDINKLVSCHRGLPFDCPSSSFSATVSRGSLERVPRAHAVFSGSCGPGPGPREVGSGDSSAVCVRPPVRFLSALPLQGSPASVGWWLGA